MAEILQFLGAGFRHAAHAFAGIEPGNGAFAEVVMQAVGVTVLD